MRVMVIDGRLGKLMRRIDVGWAKGNEAVERFVRWVAFATGSHLQGWQTAGVHRNQGQPTCFELRPESLRLNTMSSSIARCTKDECELQGLTCFSRA